MLIGQFSCQVGSADRSTNSGRGGGQGRWQRPRRRPCRVERRELGGSKVVFREGALRVARGGGAAARAARRGVRCALPKPSLALALPLAAATLLRLVALAALVDLALPRLLQRGEHADDAGQAEAEHGDHGEREEAGQADLRVPAARRVLCVDQAPTSVISASSSPRRSAASASAQPSRCPSVSSSSAPRDPGRRA